MSVAAIVIASLTAATAAGTSDCSGLAAAEAAFARGAWEQAVRCAAELASAQGYALAARARMIGASPLRDRAKQVAALERAIVDAERAIQAAPDWEEGYIQAAAAYGFLAKFTRSMRDVNRARQLIERAVALAPDNPQARAGLGYWHGGTVIAVGSFFGGLFFGADRDEAIRHFEAALDLAPDDIVIRAGYGRMLLRFRKETLAGRGLRELAVALQHGPETALERRLFEQARRLHAAAADGADLDALADMADRLAPFAR